MVQISGVQAANTYLNVHPSMQKRTVIAGGKPIERPAAIISISQEAFDKYNDMLKNGTAANTGGRANNPAYAKPTRQNTPSAVLKSPVVFPITESRPEHETAGAGKIGYAKKTEETSIEFNAEAMPALLAAITKSENKVQIATFLTPIIREMSKAVKSGLANAGDKGSMQALGVKYANFHGTIFATAQNMKDSNDLIEGAANLIGKIIGASRTITASIGALASGNAAPIYKEVLGKLDGQFSELLNYSQRIINSKSSLKKRVFFFQLRRGLAKNTRLGRQPWESPGQERSWNIF